jgi:hypothetical protein
VEQHQPYLDLDLPVCSQPLTFDETDIISPQPCCLLAKLSAGRFLNLERPRWESVQDWAYSHPRYADFRPLWKNADPDIRILKEAKAEYAKLQ